MVRGVWLVRVAVLLLAVSASRGKPVIEVIRDEFAHDVHQFIGRANSCRSVSIPAKSACAPGLLCNPNTGTCVPDGLHLKKYFMAKMSLHSKDLSTQWNLLKKDSFEKTRLLDKNLLRSLQL